MYSAPWCCRIFVVTGHTVVAAETAGGHADVQLTGPRPVQQPVPVLVGGANPALLRWGGAHADAVGLSGLDRTLADGHAHTVSWSAAQLDTHVGLVRHGAAEAGVPTPPLEALVQHVELTDDRHQAARPFAAEAASLTAAAASRLAFASIEVRVPLTIVFETVQCLGRHVKKGCLRSRVRNYVALYWFSDE